jgi:pimeloyl-ACP methyl ester carboxylesterase
MTIDQTLRTGGAYASVNGVELYDESRGTGHPLILLHGGLGSGEMFDPILSALVENHWVITVDLQGHGRTADIERPLDIRLMADDIGALIDHLGLARPAVVGYSLGGGVALQTAVRHPERVGRLVCASAHIARRAIPADLLAQQGQMNASAIDLLKNTPM